MRESIAALIDGKISTVPENTIFSAREMLPFGTSGAVYNHLYRLVKNQKIIRVSRGLYVRLTANFVCPNLEQIVAAKSRAFEKISYMHGRDAAYLLDLMANANKQTTVSTNGCSSTFASLKGRVFSKTAALRKVRLGDSHLSLVLRALWSLKKSNFSESALLKATESFTTEERLQFRGMVALMPSWIGNAVIRSGSFPLTA
jgi:hypothetical protein